MNQRDGSRGTAAGDFEPVELALGAGFLESQRIHKEALGLGDLADRKHRPMESPHGHVGADLIRGPALALVGIVLDDLELQSRRMAETQILRSETFLHTLIGHVVTFDVLFPEFDRSLRHGVSRGLDLTRSWPALHAVIRKRRVDRARLAIRIGVIEMIVRVSSVKKNRLLDKALPADLRHEVDVFLGAPCAHSDVM